MYFHVCIFGLDKSVLVKMKFLLQSVMVCNTKTHTHTHRKYRPGNDCRGYYFEARYHQVQSAEDTFSAHLFMLACYFLVLITTMTSFPMMPEKDASCPGAVKTAAPHNSA